MINHVISIFRRISLQTCNFECMPSHCHGETCKYRPIQPKMQTCHLKSMHLHNYNSHVIIFLRLEGSQLISAPIFISLDLTRPFIDQILLIEVNLLDHLYLNLCFNPIYTSFDPIDHSSL